MVNHTPTKYNWLGAAAVALWEAENNGLKERREKRVK